MGFEPVRVTQRVTGTTGISASCSAGDRPQDRIVRISLTRDAQVRHFGRPVDPATDRFELLRGTDADKGKLRIRLIPDGEIVPFKQMRKSVGVKVQAFPPVPPGKVKGTSCTVLESDRAQALLVIRLPWRDGSAG